MGALPDGYSVERDDSRVDAMFAREVKFALSYVDPDVAHLPGPAMELTAPSVRWSTRYGEWSVHVGMQRNELDADEARARALVLLMAADECERLNGERGEG